MFYLCRHEEMTVPISGTLFVTFILKTANAESLAKKDIQPFANVLVFRFRLLFHIVFASNRLSGTLKRRLCAFKTNFIPCIHTLNLLKSNNWKASYEKFILQWISGL